MSHKTAFSLRLLALLLTACCLGGLPAWAQDKVVLQLKWQPQFQFAGYYAALDQGYYTEAGLDVEVRPLQPDGNAIEEVLQGRAQYGTAGSELLLAYMKGKPLVALAAIMQHSPSALMVRADSGLSNPHDLIGKRVMISPQGEHDIWAMFLQEGISTGAFEQSPATWDMEELLDGRIDAMVVYLTTSPYPLLERDVGFQLIRPSSYGVDFYGDCLFTTQQEAKEHPDRVQRFLEASLRGWRWAMNNPQEAAFMLRERFGAKASMAQLMYEFEAMRGLMLPQLVDIGHMNPGRWRAIADTYVMLRMAKPVSDLKPFLFAPEHGFPQWVLVVFAIVGGLAVVGTALALWLWVFNRRLSYAVAGRTAELKQEVEERRRVEVALRAREEELASIFRNATVGIFQSTPEGRYLSANEYMARLFGYDSADQMVREVTSIQDQIYVDPLDRQRFMALLEQQQGETFGYEARNRTRNGDIIWTSVNARAVRDDQGQTKHYDGFLVDITERVRAQEALLSSQAELAESRARLALAVDVARIAPWELDLKTRIFTFDEQFYVLYGTSKDREGGTTMSLDDYAREFVHPEDRAMVAAETDRALQNPEGGHCTQAEHRIIRRDGEVRHVVVRYCLMHDAQGNPIKTIGANQDITEAKRAAETLKQDHDLLEVRVRERTKMLSRTNKQLLDEVAERKRAEAALARSRELLELTERVGGIGGWELDITSNELTWTKETYAIHECSEDFQPTVENALQFYTPEHRPAISRALDLLRETGEPYSLELCMQTGQDREAWVLTQGEAEYRDGRLVRLFGTIQDIDSRKRAEDARKESQLRWEALVRTLHAGVAVHGPDGIARDCNPMALELLGVTREQFVGHSNLVELLPLQDGAGRPMGQEERPVGRAIRTRRPVRDQLLGFIRRVDGKPAWILGNFTPLLDEQGQVSEVIVAFMDVTELKKTQENLRTALRDAEAANKAKSEFLANMSHEFRTPMNGIMGMVELLRTTELTEEQTNHLAAMDRSAQALMELLSNILDLSRIEAGLMGFNPAPFNLSHLVQNVLGIWRKAAMDKGLELHMSLDPGLPLNVSGDMERIRQTLSNLVGNAIKFTGQGRVDVDVSCAGEACPPPKAEGGQERWEVAFTVKDTGIGIAPEDHALVFESFRQVDGSHTRRYSGTGLGLTIASRLAHAMGGRIELESSLGQGSTFRLVLPLGFAS